jgi:tetratricopeptide (TPR) repeat protein
MADLSPELAAKIQTLEGGYADNPGRYFVALAGAWREAGEISRAEEILRENLKRFPGLSAHVLLGRCLADRGAFQEAANEFHYVLSIDAQNLIALRTLAEMAAAGGRRSEAERWYNELLAVDPMNAEARAALAELARGAASSAAAQPAPAAGGAQPQGGEFGMIDLAAPGASSADASGAAADDEGEWGDLPLEMGDEPQPAAASAPAGDFDAFGFGSVDLDAAGGDADPWLAPDARQDLGATAATDAGDFGSPEDDTLLDAPTAGADLPFLDADDTVGADDLPLLDVDATREFGGFDAPPHAEPSAFAAADPGAGLPPMDHGPDDVPVDHEVDAEVVTETMAELYAAQGLLQQSADTYRELIRQRGEEPGLVRRLAEIEARLNPAAPAQTAEEETPDWLASVDEFAMGGAAASLAAIHMSAEQPEAEPEPAADFEPLPAADDFEPVAAPASSFDGVHASAGEFDAGPAAADRFDVDRDTDAVAPVAGFDYLTTADAAAEAGTDSFADSFAGGFEGAQAETPEHAFAPPVAEFVAEGHREPWQAPAVRATEPVGFDLIVVEEDGGEVPAPPEVVADVSADWAIAAAPLEDDEEEAAEATTAGAVTPAAAGVATMRAYFTGLLSWQPGQSTAAPAAVEEPVEAPYTGPAEDEEWAEAPAPPVADEPWDAAPAPADDEPWDAAPASAGDEPWSEAPAAPADEAPAYDLPAAASPEPADEPWALPSDAAASQPAAPAGGDDLPLMDLADEPWSAPRAPEPASIDTFTLADEIAPAASSADDAAPADEEALPWELPAEPQAAPAADAGSGFSFEDFFAGGGPSAPVETPIVPEPEPEPVREPEETPEFVPSMAFEPAPAPAPVAQTPAASSPTASAPAAGGQEEEDEDLESFQAWLQSLKR